MKGKQLFKNLAKIKPDETIIEHTSACYDVAKQLVKIFKKEITILDSDSIKGDDIFMLSVLFHDFGKYAQPFQNKTLNSNYEGCWGYRHEIFSAEFVNLISDFSDEVKNIVKLAILSHHNKTIDHLEQAVFEEHNAAFLMPGINLEPMNTNRKEAYEEAKSSIIQYFSAISAEIKEILQRLSLKVSISFNHNQLSNVFDLIKKYYVSAYNFEMNFDYKKIVFLKGLLVTSDHLGSAHHLIKQLDYNICSCYEKKFKIPEKGEFTTTQKKCIESLGETAILKAPTGTGKTEASFLWANENIKKTPYSRIFYILPYTASINAMFERLNTSDFSKNKVDLLHGKSISYYFELFTKDIPDEEIEENIKEINKKVRLQRLTAKSFVNPIKVVTPHQIVKNFYGLKHFEESFIQYIKGLFIFDEIHCYDKVFLAELIVAIKKIKDDFNGKFLFMSATFPRIIENLLSKYLEIKHPVIEFNDSELHKYTKTKLNLMDGLIENFLSIKKIQNDIDNGKRVLIVCNTINKAQEVFKQIGCPKKIMLHSAFNVNDRKGIEQEIIESEKKDDNEKNQVLIGTQAIEVSLDLDYDCCYSEIASIDALIQRFGRVFRNRKRAKGEFGIVNVFLEADDATKLIYNEKNEDFISRTRKELLSLNSKSLDYQSICDAVDKVFPESYGDLIEKIVVEKLELMKNSELIPMKDYSSEAKAYFEQFDGIKILPSLLFNQYDDYIESQRFIEADNLLVNLSERKLFSYYRKNYIYKMQVKGRNIFMADESILGYSKQKGLYLKDLSDYNFI